MYSFRYASSQVLSAVSGWHCVSPNVLHCCWPDHHGSPIRVDCCKCFCSQQLFSFMTWWTCQDDIKHCTYESICDVLSPFAFPGSSVPWIVFSDHANHTETVQGPTCSGAQPLAFHAQSIGVGWIGQLDRSRKWYNFCVFSSGGVEQKTVRLSHLGHAHEQTDAGW